MIGEAPKSHQDRIDRETRRGEQKEAKAREKELIEEYGEATDVVPDDRYTCEKYITVEGADCPDCEDGVIRVVPQHDSYPPWKEICTECGER